MERVTRTLISPCVKYTANRNLLYVSGHLTGALKQPRGWDGAGDGREVQKGGDICILTADSC